MIDNQVFAVIDARIAAAEAELAAAEAELETYREARRVLTGGAGVPEGGRLAGLRPADGSARKPRRTGPTVAQLTWDLLKANGAMSITELTRALGVKWQQIHWVFTRSLNAGNFKKVGDAKYVVCGARPVDKRGTRWAERKAGKVSQ